MTTYIQDSVSIGDQRSLKFVKFRGRDGVLIRVVGARSQRNNMSALTKAVHGKYPAGCMLSTM